VLPEDASKLITIRTPRTTYLHGFYGIRNDAVETAMIVMIARSGGKIYFYFKG
jgi:hypothetical protein